MSEKNGGPAFPVVDTSGDYPNCHLGMSLRDYFAANAMQAVIASGCIVESDAGKAIACARAYGLADAMLDARSTMLEARKK